MSATLAHPVPAVLDQFPNEAAPTQASVAPRLTSLARRAGYEPLTRTAVRAYMDAEYLKAMASASSLARLFARHPILLKAGAWLCGWLAPISAVATVGLAAATAAQTVFGILDPGPVSWIVLGFLVTLSLGLLTSALSGLTNVLAYAHVEIESIMWRRIRVDMQSLGLPWYAKRAIIRLGDVAKQREERVDFYLHSLGDDPFLEAVYRGQDGSKQAEFILGYDHGFDQHGRLCWYALRERDGKIVSALMNI